MTILNNKEKLDTTLLIVADDLTGAGDTGVEFCGIDEVIVTDRHDLAGISCSKRHKIISVNTATRNLPGKEAETCISGLKPWIEQNRPGMIFKKIDSCMRGAPGLEIKALMDVQKPRAIVVPALPNHGRIVEDGVLKLNGVPLDQSYMRNDPLSPMTESRPDVILEHQSGKSTFHLGLIQVRKGPQELELCLTEAFSRGVDIVSLDAVTNEDLDSIARVALALYQDTLICASSGLASAMGRVMGKPCVSTPPAIRHGRGLYLCGSASSVQQAQIEKLRRDKDASELILGDKKQQFDPARSAHIFRLPFIDECKLDARTACQRLCREAMVHVENNHYGFIFVSGGDTADAFFALAGAKRFYLRGMLLPGIPWGYVKAGMLEKTIIITKSGAFGAEDTLTAIHQRIGKGD